MTTRRTSWGRLGAALIAVVVLGAESRASVTQALTRADLAANDLIDWGDLGPNGTLVGNPFATTSSGGLGAAVSKDSSEDFQVLVQGDGWAGNFSPGDSVLWTNSYPSVSFNAITLVFDDPVMGAGANIQQVNALAFFTGVIEAYDSTNTLLALVSAIGTSNANGDGSALFLGLKGTEANIKRIRFYLTAAPFNYIGSYGINQVGVVRPTAPPPSAAPEPATAVPAALVLLIVAGRSLQARRRVG